MSKLTNYEGGRRPQPIGFVVDDRELPSGVLEVLAAMGHVSVEIRRLALGDYEVDGKLLIERKTLFDLAASIKDGRLFHQGCRLASSARRSAIILEGRAGDLAASGMRREAIQGALITLTIFLGIPILRARDLQESARLMLYAARQGRAIADGALPRKGARPKGKRSTQLHILQGLPGVGPERALRLLEAFGSVEAALRASTDDLTAVSGIGSTTAEAIRWAVREAALGYRSDDADDPIL